MRTRTFIGLILLVALLMVAATPALLAPLAERAQRVAVRAGVPGVSPAPEPVVAKAPGAKSAAKSKVKPVLALRGRIVGDDGSLRDQYNDATRANAAGLRTLAGARRTLLLGQIDRNSAPIPLQGGVLLDQAGCPEFTPDQDVAALWRTPELKQRYEDKIAAADDPTACRRLVRQRRDAATGDRNGNTLPGDAREADRLLRAGSEDVAFLNAYSRMAGAMFPDYDKDQQDALDYIKARRGKST